MALKAGYVGVKRWVYEKLQTTVAKNTKDIPGKVSWSDARNSVKKNYMVNTAVSKTENGGTFTVNADKTVTVTTSDSFSANSFLNLGFFTLKAGRYVLSQGVKTGDANARVQLADENTSVVAYISSGNSDHAVFTLNEDKIVQGWIRIPSGWNTSSITFKPMITLAGVPFDDYIEWIPDNVELAATLNDHKTTINGIISAATGAADFAAFKTAMAALTPLTRSTAPDTREASPEVIADDPEPVTKTTRSTKKTATTKEGE